MQTSAALDCFLSLANHAFDTPDEAFDSSVYYDHVLALRTVVLDLHKYDVASEELRSNDLAFALHHQILPRMGNSITSAQVGESFYSRLVKLKNLLNGKKRWGERVNERLTKRQVDDDGHPNHRREIMDLSEEMWIRRQLLYPPPTVSLADTLEDPWDEADLIEGVATDDGTELYASNALDVVQIRRVHQNQLASINVPTVSDIFRHSAAQMRFWATQLFSVDPMVARFCWLTWATGLDPNRLVITRFGDGDPSLKTPVWDMRTHQLRYFVEHFRVAKNKHPQVMTLQLPSGWTHQISKDNAERPFAEIRNKYAKIRLTFPELRFPKLGAWAASSCHFFSPKLDAVEQDILAGRLSRSHTAPATYRCIDLNQLNQTICNQWTVQIDRISNNGNIDFANHFRPPSQPTAEIAPIGSELAGSLNAWKDFNVSLRRLKTLLLRRPQYSAQAKLDRLVVLSQIQSLSAYLGYAIISVGRELNDRTNCELTENSIWLADKTNGQYSERKWFQFEPGDLTVKCYRHQLTALTASFKLIGERAALSYREDSPHLPRFVQKNGDGFMVKRLTSKAFRTLAKQLDLYSHDIEPLNRIRHRFASHANAPLPEPVRNEIMGHKHPGEDFFGNESAATVESLVIPSQLPREWAQEADWSVIDLPLENL